MKFENFKKIIEMKQAEEKRIMTLYATGIDLIEYMASVK